MGWIDIIIKIGAGVAAVSGIIAAIIGIWKITNAIVNAAKDMRETKEYVMRNVPNVESIPAIEQHCRENYLTSLRLTIMCENMPLGERIAAGIKYLEAGGNGETKKYLIEELHIYDVQKD